MPFAHVASYRVGVVEQRHGAGSNSEDRTMVNNSRLLKSLICALPVAGLIALATPSWGEGLGGVGINNNGGKGLGVSIGGRSGINASVGVRNGVDTDVSIGGRSGVNASADVSVGNGVSGDVDVSIGGGVRSSVRATIGNGVGADVDIDIGGDDVANNPPGGNPPGTRPPGANPPTGNPTTPTTSAKLPSGLAGMLADMSDSDRRKLKKKCFSILAAPTSFSRDMVAVCRVLQLANS